jgi:hypothetical protein
MRMKHFIKKYGAVWMILVVWSCSKDETPYTPPIVEEDPSIEIPASNTVGALLLDADKADKGYTLFTIDKYTYLINNCGQVINTWSSDYTDGKAVYLLEDGSILRGGVLENTEVPYPGSGGIVEKISWDNEVVWS